MKRTSLQPLLKKHPGIFVIAMSVSLAFVFTAFSNAVHAQGNQLTLADILIALRSKKVTLSERNKILTDGVQRRGTTFLITPEIERELSATGAGKSLIDSIRRRSEIVKIAVVVPSPVVTRPKAEPVASPALPDFSFYEKRADVSSSKGDIDAAIIDYTKAIEMNGGAVTALHGRGASYYNKNSYTLAIADYNKVIELDPQNSAAYSRRGEAYEKKGNFDVAEADYKKATEIDPANESAKLGAARVMAEKARATQKPESETVPVPAPAPVAAPVLPEFLDLGQLAEAQAIKMVKPVYSPIAFKAGIGGKVVINVELDIEGNVTSAKAVSGHSYLRQNSEDAARKCKFRPAMVGTQAIKAKGSIVYNFVPAR